MSNWTSLPNWKGQSSKLFKRLLKIIALVLSIVSCTNTNHEVTDLVIYGMVRNTKIWVLENGTELFYEVKKLLTCASYGTFWEVIVLWRWSLSNGSIHTDLYIKPADSHQYIQYHSSYPLCIRTSIPFSQALRVSRICSSEKDFKMHVFHMKKWFLARGYQEIVVNIQIDKVVSGETNMLRKIWKVAFLLLLPVTLRLKSWGNWLGTYFLF